nr:hypothetical protein [Tanacetum cinerariifolium]
MDDLETNANKDVVNDVDRPQDDVAPKTNKPSRDTSMVSTVKDPLTFDDLMATPIDFSKFAMNRLKLDHLTQEILIGPVYNLLKGTCTSNIELNVKKLHGYGHLEEIVVKRVDRQLYKFKEGDFVDLHLNDIENMLFLAVQHKLIHLNDNDIVDFIMALRMFTRSLIIKRRVKDLQLGVESYQKKLNITKPHKIFLEIEFKELFTLTQKPPGNTRFSSGIEQEDIKAKVDDYRQKKVRTYGRAY